MFDDESDFFSSSIADYEEQASPAILYPRTKPRKANAKQISSSTGGMFGMSNERRRRRILEITAHYDRENRLHRKPCCTCGNLVKPELLDQHNAAYHS